MRGLEYILYIYDEQHQSLADKFGIRKQNINKWIKGKQNIPKKYLPELVKIFGIPEEYFEKELTDLDKIIIQHAKLQKELNESIKLNVSSEKEDLDMSQLAFNIDHNRSNGELYYEDKDYFSKSDFQINILKMEINKQISDLKYNSEDFYKLIKSFIDIANNHYFDGDFKKNLIEFMNKWRNIN
jgi:transcriptional regulator with XRE-family HTH domain